jgi:DNA mismatch repair protein MutH
MELEVIVYYIVWKEVDDTLTLGKVEKVNELRQQDFKVRPEIDKDRTHLLGDRM